MRKRVSKLLAVILSVAIAIGCDKKKEVVQTFKMYYEPGVGYIGGIEGKMEALKQKVRFELPKEAKVNAIELGVVLPNENPSAQLVVRPTTSTKADFLLARSGGVSLLRYKPQQTRVIELEVTAFEAKGIGINYKLYLRAFFRHHHRQNSLLSQESLENLSTDRLSSLLLFRLKLAYIDKKGYSTDAVRVLGRIRKEAKKEAVRMAKTIKQRRKIEKKLFRRMLLEHLESLSQGEKAKGAK